MEAHPCRDKGFKLCSFFLRGGWPPAQCKQKGFTQEFNTRGASRDAAAGTGDGAQGRGCKSQARAGPSMTGQACGQAARGSSNAPFSSAPKSHVDRPSASTHVQAPPAESVRSLVLIQLSGDTDSLTLLLLINIPAVKAAVQAREQQGSSAAGLGERGSRVALMVARLLRCKCWGDTEVQQ
eukprot:97125-Pelagomonas_calceolata.AAC.2